jgi:hypothetical protein
MFPTTSGLLNGGTSIVEISQNTIIIVEKNVWKRKIW